MPELRKDPIVGRWVIIATERARRPVDYKHEAIRASGGFCPFCPGNEDKTPREVLVYKKAPPALTSPTAPPVAVKDEWTLRVVPNKFPALGIEGELDRAGEGLYDKMNGVGAHEVIIESPYHDVGLADLPATEIELVFLAFRDRIEDLKKDARFRYVMCFKNHGAAAGASMEHTHSQLIALPVVPTAVSERMAGARQHYEQKERCIFCDIVRQELADRRRVIYENAGFAVIAPYAPKLPFETWVLPKRHGSHYEHTAKEDFALLADALRVALRKLNVALDEPPYNLFLHTAPLNEGASPSYHWHIEIIPTLTKVAGFEWGSGFYINPTPPEDAAAFLRDIQE